MRVYAMKLDILDIKLELLVPLVKRRGIPIRGTLMHAFYAYNTFVIPKTPFFIQFWLFRHSQIQHGFQNQIYFINFDNYSRQDYKNKVFSTSKPKNIYFSCQIK